MSESVVEQLPQPVQQALLPQQESAPPLNYAYGDVAAPEPPTPSYPALRYQQGLALQSTDLFAPTGIPGLDEILGGGFLRGKTYLVAGEAGCGKTIFSIQFLIHGALIGEPGLYIAIDEPTNQLLRGLRLFGWDLGDLISSRRLMFLDMRTHFSKIYLRDERKHIEPRYIIEQILAAARKINAKRLVIDPIAPLVYGGKEEDVLYAREFLREMVFAIEKTGELTTIMTSEIPTGSSKLSRFGVEEFLASGIIVLGIEEIYGNVERVMYIRKARWAPVKPSKYIFDIVSGRGIVIREPLSEYIKRVSRGSR
ncbi:MAG: AAA family ATPase [Thermofilum sp.]|nr:AAA family ATPase [Thermofilum sp.]MCC6058924.1 AAA family ATPase [Thermofilum sp.]